MKKQTILRWAVMGLALCGLSTQAALLGITEPGSSDPFYADFTSSHLSVNYTYSGGIGEFVVSGNSSSGTYESDKSSPGTGNGSQGINQTFSGTYSLTAYVEDIGGQWQVIDSGSDQSTVTITGYLPGVSPNPGGTTPSETLLTANLKTGANSFGYSQPGDALINYNEFDFLFTVTGGDSEILQDFFGVGGQGAIILNPNTYNPMAKYTGNLEQNFYNINNSGQANTYVPESCAYPLAASITALFGFAGAAISRRKQVKMAVRE